MPRMAEQMKSIYMPISRQSESPSFHSSHHPPSLSLKSVPTADCRRFDKLCFLTSRTNYSCRRIKNPLAHVSPEQLRIDVENFANEHQLTEMTPLLMKGAFVAKDPPAFESVEGLTEHEKTAIRNEVLHKWRQPKALFFTIILCSIGAAVQSVHQDILPVEVR